MKLCECGCGEPAPIARQTLTKRGWRKGQPLRFRQGHWLRAQSGPTLPQWRGGRHYQSDGYVMIWKPDHPRAYDGRYMLEHIVVAEKMLGRLLEPNETVHHKNHVRDDNRPENLEVMTRSEHNRQHRLKEGRRGRPEFCSEPNCDERCYASGLCKVHYGQVAHKRRWSDPDYRDRELAKGRERWKQKQLTRCRAEQAGTTSS